MSKLDATAEAVVDAAVNFILNEQALRGSAYDETERHGIRVFVLGTFAYMLTTAERLGYDAVMRSAIASLVHGEDQ